VFTDGDGCFLLDDFLEVGFCLLKFHSFYCFADFCCVFGGYSEFSSACFCGFCWVEFCCGVSPFWHFLSGFLIV